MLQVSIVILVCWLPAVKIATLGQTCCSAHLQFATRGCTLTGHA